jgi:DNA polymerase-3 subunit gamma/tau
LKEITQAEGIETETGALALISRAAEGSMRDALSLLDQVIAFAGTQISMNSVRESIGLIDGQILIGILTGICKREPTVALKLIGQAFEDGHDLRVLTRSLIEFLHGILLAKVGSPNSGTLAFSEEEWQELQALSALRPVEELELIFQVLHQGLEWVAKSPQPKIVLDVIVIKCAAAEALVYLGKATESSASSISSNSSVKAVPQTVVNPLKIEPKPAIREISIQNSSEKTWEGLIEWVRKTRPLLASILEHACDTHLPVQNKGTASDPTLVIHFSSQNSYFREQLLSRNYQEQLMQLTKEYFAGPIRLIVEIKDQGESLIHKREREQKARTELLKERVQRNPIIMEAKSLFGGDLGPIDIISPEAMSNSPLERSNASP